MSNQHPEYLEITVSRIYSDVNQKEDSDFKNINKCMITPGSISNYQLISPIGHGKYSNVFYGKVKKSKYEKLKETNDRVKSRKCAIKILKNISFQRIKKEICMLSYLQDVPSVVRLYDTVKDFPSNTISIITEYEEPINIQKFYQSLTIDEIRHLMFNLLLTLDLCHRKGVMHRDVKPGNIVIRSDRKNLFLIDWGLAEFYMPNRRCTTSVSTLRYKAPELLLNYEYYDYGIDVWGAGIVLAEMLIKFPFFRGKTAEDMISNITSIWGVDNMVSYYGKYGITLSPETISLFPKASGQQWQKTLSAVKSAKADPDAFDLLKKLLVIDHSQRVTAREALMHPFFDSVRDKICSQYNYVLDPPQK